MGIYKLVQVAGGWTFAGRVMDDGLPQGMNPGSDRIYMEDVSLVHEWGAEQGLGQLQAGPLPKTVLHPIPILEGSSGMAIERRSVRCVFSINEDKWAPKLVCQRPTNGPAGTRTTAMLIQVAGGWTFVGKFLKDEDDRYILTNAQIVHEWGAQKGLGELVAGPLEKTVSYPVFTEESEGLHIERRSVRCAISISAAGWANKLGYVAE